MLHRTLGAIAMAAVLSNIVAPTQGAAATAAAGAAVEPCPPHCGARAPLLFAEAWRQSPEGGEHPVTGDSLANPDLQLKLYVPAGQVELTGVPADESNPVHVWTGLCTSPCAVTLRDKSRFADLSGLAHLRWNTKTSGLHQLRPLLRLADGTYLVADRGSGSIYDWLVSELSFSDLRWIRLDIARVVTVGNPLAAVDLSKVDEIGFADLMPGSGHGPGGWSDLAQIEVYAGAVPR